MWSYYPELLAKPVPRYTSYPTAADFGDIAPATYVDALAGADGDVSLYVHIPFCEKICFYCGCNTAAAGKRHRLKSYLDALHREIALVGERLNQGCRIRRIAFGGGSPNAIEPGEFREILDLIGANFQLDEPVISIELDPRTMSAEWADAIAEAGVERASLGVQTFAPHCQKAIGRVQSEAQIRQTLEWLREAGVTSINFDLMYGLPEQTSEDLRDTLERAVAMHADRIALFGYAHVPHVVPRQRAIDAGALPDAGARFEMAALGYDLLKSAGYAEVGFDHFAKPDDPLALATREGKLRRNFQGFTDDQAPVLIGLGCSAISSFPDFLAQNEKNSGRYRMKLSQSQLTVTRGIARSQADQLRGSVIENLLCHGEADIPPVLLGQVRNAIVPFIDKSLAVLDEHRLTITPNGLPYARTIAALFDGYRKTTASQFSSAI